METCFRVSDPIGRLESFGLPRYLAKSFWDEVVKWETNSGPAWTVKHLKNLKTDVLRLKAGLPQLSWLRKNRRGLLYGAVGALFRYSERSDRCFMTIVNCLMVYSGFIPGQPTKQHVEQFHTSVSAPPIPLPKGIGETIACEAREWLGTPKLASPTRLIDFQGSPSVKSPIYGKRSVFQNESLEEELCWITQNQPFAFVGSDSSLFLNKYYSCYGPVLDGLDRILAHNVTGLQGLSHQSDDMGPFQTRFANQNFALDPSSIEGGVVVPLTKDGGWKVRWIASPYRLHQLALKPLGLSLFRLLKTLPWDCTHDQEKAIPVIQHHLQLGKTAHAVDLSSATDYFPLDLQLQVLDGLYPNSPYVKLFGDLSRSTWKSPMGPVSWTRGQPMGLYPSFASFGLTHGFLLKSLCGVYRSQFFVLGDDVVILDDELHSRYMQSLEMLECPHDLHKSLSSDVLTEFAGKIITKENVFPQYKWRQISDDNFLAFMRAYGQRFEKNLTRKQRRVYRMVGELLSPVGCEHSRGRSEPLEVLIERTDDFLSTFKTEEKGRKFYTSFLRKLIRILKPDQPKSLFHRLDYRRMGKISETFDQKVSSAFQRLPQWIFPFSEDVTDLFELSETFSGLTAVGSEKLVDQKTLLKRYEEALGIQNS